MLEAIQLTKSYNDYLAIDNLNLSIKPGEIFALLGQNGAGKTTTLNCFLGFTKPSSGTVLVFGDNIIKNTQNARKNIAYISENVMLYQNLSGFENLQFFSKIAGIKYSATQLESFLFEVGLKQNAHHMLLKDYSKGMRQKVGIAIALAKNAKALILDEPTSGLDPKASNDFSEILIKMAKKNMAVLMATHDIFRAKETANRIGIMKEGKLINIINSKDISATELEKFYLTQID